jgi:hypothetical protein
MGNKPITPKAKIFMKEGIFFTYMDMIKFIEDEIIYQLLPEYQEIKEFIPKERRLMVISPNGYQEEIKQNKYSEIINNPIEIRLLYDNTLVDGYEINFHFAIRYPANVKMSLQDFNPKIKINKQLMDNTEITFLEKVVIDIRRKYHN